MLAVIARYSRGLLVKSRDSILHQICRHIPIGEIKRLGGRSVGSASAPLGRELPYKRDWCRRRSLVSCGSFPDQRLIIEPRQSAAPASVERETKITLSLLLSSVPRSSSPVYPPYPHALHACIALGLCCTEPLVLQAIYG